MLVAPEKSGLGGVGSKSGLELMGRLETGSHGQRLGVWSSAVVGIGGQRARALGWG